jgi:cytochrome c peroxidase
MALLAWALLAVAASDALAESPATGGGATTREPILPIPLHLDQDQRKVALGERLFSEPQLSRDDSVACVSCHDLALGGTDHRPRSIGIGGAVGEVNAPTVLNSDLNFRQFWDGRARTLEEQIDGPVHAEGEMGSEWPTVIGKLERSGVYQRAFSAIYPDGITERNVKDAIATFERSLYTPDARFDRFLRGNHEAITADEREGYRIFKSYGCVSCHQGMGVGGNMFQTFGVMADYFADRGDVTRADLGRYNVTKDPADRHVFKVPSLRNVALTAPYFHDGSAESLEDAVAVMGNYQLGRSLSPHEISLIVQFLGTLTGEGRAKVE